MLHWWNRWLRRNNSTIVPLIRWTTGNPPRLQAPAQYWS